MNLTLYVTLVTCTVACGGKPFTTLDYVAPEAGDGESASEASVPDSDAAPDGDAAPATEGSVPDATDSGGAESAVDAGDAAEDTPACALGQPFGCNGNGGVNELVTPPAKFCGCSNGTCTNVYGPEPTPPECSTCETYTCACIEAHAPGSIKSCSESAGQITVTYY